MQTGMALFDSWKEVCEGIGDIFVFRCVLDVKMHLFQVISVKLISDLNLFRLCEIRVRDG